MKRREFIQTSSMAMGAMLLPSFVQANKKKIGLQLYSLRDAMPKDPKATLKTIAGFGYTEIETYGYEDGKLFGLTARDFASYCKSIGLKVPSGHYSTGQAKPSVKGTLINDWERAVADAKEIGQEFMIIAWLDPTERKSLDDYKKVCDLINKNAEICKNYGIRIGYHNHEFEFMPLEGQVPYDLMLSLLDKKTVSMELDLYWTSFANVNPVDYFTKYPGRFEQWHVKDMDKSDPKKQVDFGTGRIDYKSLFAQAKLSGLKHFYIEQEQYPVSSLESIKSCIGNFKKMM